MSYPSGQIYTVYNPTSSIPMSSNIITQQSSPTVIAQQQIQQTNHLSFNQPSNIAHYYQPTSQTQTYLSQQPTNSNLLSNIQQPQVRVCRPSFSGLQIVNSSTSSTFPMLSNVNINPNSSRNNQLWRVSNPQTTSQSQLSITTTPTTVTHPQNKIIYISTLPSSQSSNNIHTTNILQPVKIISSPPNQIISTVRTVNILNQTNNSIQQQSTPTFTAVSSPSPLSNVLTSFSSSKLGQCITPTPVVTGNVGALTIQQTLHSTQQQYTNMQRVHSVNNSEHVMNSKPVNSPTEMEEEEEEDEDSGDESDLEQDTDAGDMIVTTLNQQQTETKNTQLGHSASIVDDPNVDDVQQDQEIELIVNNVVSSFSLGCKIQLRKVAMEGAHVEYKRDNAMVMMKIRKPYCSANIWASGKVTVTGSTSEDDALRGARRIARTIQRLGFKAKFCNYRVVNVLATCIMPFNIDIVKLSHDNSLCVSYEPEIHPGATVRLKEFSSTMKVFTTGSITLTAPSVDNVNFALNAFYPRLYECRKRSLASRSMDRRNQHH
ncbi:unnamed protein product [Didymodactylos carnosus]|uniref:TATA box-binding protein-like 1 n=1 Tax=Didymodactylos carnosus TaxID=1234261 RepID=A0A813RI71_9BILA|nr:unnamed protein product [Didymodactylos carnosus]CAF0990134.1 unnamed protein product [Didymodactylos carnosus]CAF3566260.1 unnamed protein product [Didymodactylos carnosus]CAF3760265.1 unnamed protein product [Didymodactylos carnosus]